MVLISTGRDLMLRKYNKDSNIQHLYVLHCLLNNQNHWSFCLKCKAISIYRFIYKALHFLKFIKSSLFGKYVTATDLETKVFSSSEIHNLQCLCFFSFCYPLSLNIKWRGVGTLEPLPSWDMIHFLCVQDSEHLCLLFAFFSTKEMFFLLWEKKIQALIIYESNSQHK